MGNRFIRFPETTNHTKGKVQNFPEIILDTATILNT